MKLTDVYKYNCYRTWLRELLNENNLGYATFCTKQNSMSLPSLAKVLQKRKDTSFTFAYRVAPEILAALCSELGYKHKEIDYIVALRLENDGDNLPGTHGKTFKASISRIIKILKKAKKSVTTYSANKIENDNAFKVLFDSLPEKQQKMLTQELLAQIEICRGRRTLKAPVSFLKNYIETLNQ